jgi:hypothetical protein
MFVVDMWEDPGRGKYLSQLQQQYLQNSVDATLWQMKMDGADYSNFDSVLSWVKQNEKGKGIHPPRLAAMIRQQIAQTR